MAEVTGRSRRIVERPDPDGIDRPAVENRQPPPTSPKPRHSRMTSSASSSFPMKGYRAFLPRGSRQGMRFRVITLLEAGWRAMLRSRGLGRTNRTNHSQPPLFRAIATNVKAEKRFWLDHRSASRHVRRHHQRPAPDRGGSRACSAPKTISKVNTRAMRFRGSCASLFQSMGLALRDPRGRSWSAIRLCVSPVGRAA